MLRSLKEVHQTQTGHQKTKLRKNSKYSQERKKNINHASAVWLALKRTSIDEYAVHQNVFARAYFGTKKCSTVISVSGWYD